MPAPLPPDEAARLLARTVELTGVNDALHSEIRKRQLADHERRRSEHHFRQLFNQASDAAMVHDLDGRLVDVNEAACTSLGYTRGELLTMGVPDFEMKHDPAEGFRFWRELAVGSVEKFEGCHRRKDGSTFPVEVHVSVLETAAGRQLLALIRDITVQKQRQQDLLQSEERFRLAILHSPLPVMLYTNNGEILQVNHAWTRLTGYRADELRTVDDWLGRCCPSTEEREEVRGSLAKFMNHDGSLERPGRRIRCADGSERIWDLTRANLNRLADGRGLHITTAVDVTERHQAEAALRAAKDEAERANQAKSVFLSRMSHELRTPLNAILGFGQLLELSTLDKQDAMSLSYILKGGRHLLALIDEVLDLSRVETGDFHLSREHVDIAGLAQECVGLVARLAQARGITCRVSVPAGPSLWADDQRLRQMLLNLLSNAIKYNREGGDVLVSSEETVGGRLRLKVSDTGPGIPPEGLARLFVPFERLEQEFSEEEGTGLGLVISRRIAEAMGGTLGVESEAGQGSTFWIELPLAASSPTAPPTVIPAPSPPVSAPKTEPNATLLYIEDNHSNLQVVKALLANCRPRWQFMSAQDGRTGLEQARQSLPGLILLDLQLPGMNGDAVLAELRNDPRTRHIPVVLLSADATPHSRERLLASGADDYISKPFKLDQLLDLLDRTLLNAAVGGQI